MATVVKNFEDLDLSKQYTYSDYLLWQFSERVELIRGWIKKMSPAPNRAHQTLLFNLTMNIGKYANNVPCKMFFAPFDVRLPIKSKKKDTTVVQPDFCIVCDKSKLDDQGCNGAPDLIVEILSPSNARHDLDTKFNLYEEAGVQEYWIVQPQSKTILIYVLENDRYIGLKPFGEDQIAAGRLFPEMKIDVNEVFMNV